MNKTNDTPNSDPTISLLGCGWLGIALAPSLQQNGFFVRGSTTQTAKLSVLIVNIPPEAAMGADFHPSQIKEILHRLKGHKDFKHLLYVSSTSVYGSTQGLVDETTTPSPDPGSGEILVHAETLLREAAEERGFALTIVRSAGQMGPGRHPGLFLSGRQNVKDANGPVNMIH
ncbi:MAG: hypothetical protein EOP05_23650, partial [Proteobacteria bacterium]